MSKYKIRGVTYQMYPESVQGVKQKGGFFSRETPEFIKESMRRWDTLDEPIEQDFSSVFESALNGLEELDD